MLSAASGSFSLEARKFSKFHHDPCSAGLVLLVYFTAFAEFLNLSTFSSTFKIEPINID